MPVYDFSYRPATTIPEAPAQHPVGSAQLGHVASLDPGHAAGRSKIAHIQPTSQAALEDINEFLIPGFRSLDEAMQMYWSGIRVPTKDNYRFLKIKIAGQDKSVAVWREELLNGKAVLPVAALNHNDERFNKDKFSPAYHPMAVKFLNTRGNLAAAVYRPSPWLVNYTLSVWAEHKRDSEMIKYQVLTRFNSHLAEFMMNDGHLRGSVQLRFEGATDQSDKEADFGQHRLIKMSYAMVAEAWLPLPERVMHTVLGTVFQTTF